MAARLEAPEPGAEGPGHSRPRIPRVPETTLARQAAQLCRKAGGRPPAQSRMIRHGEH
jgi:hypothetical protein